MISLSGLRRSPWRTVTSSATRSVCCTVGLAALALGLAPSSAAASHPRHAKAHAAAHTARQHASATARHAAHGSKTKEKASHGASRHASAHHKASHESRSRHSAHAARHQTHGRAHREVEVAEQAPAAPAPLAIPQFALPDLALSAATFSAGEGLAGPSRTTTMIPAASASRTLAAITHSATSLLDALVARARGQLGTRYVFGGADPGAALDCSSFARYAMEALGVRLPRTANQQAQIGRPIPRDPSLLRPGDLLTFGSRHHVSHVGIYLGAGRFIHASVSHGEVIETTIDRNRSLFRRWQGARRLLAAAGDSADGSGTTGG